MGILADFCNFFIKKTRSFLWKSGVFYGFYGASFAKDLSLDAGQMTVDFGLFFFLVRFGLPKMVRVVSFARKNDSFFFFRHQPLDRALHGFQNTAICAAQISKHTFYNPTVDIAEEGELFFRAKPRWFTYH